MTPEAGWLEPDFVAKQKFVIDGRQDNPYLFSDRGEKILAVAHLDVVGNLKPEFTIAKMKGHEEPSDKVYAWTPYGDDRAGVYTVMYHLPKMGLKYDLLLTTGEEHGRSSAKRFKSDKQYNWIFEFDRRGTDVVMYSYEDGALGEGKFFDKLLALFGMQLGTGSFSDIEALQSLNCIGFNIGTGYMNEHTQDSYIDLDDLDKQINKFVKFYEAFKDIRLEYAVKTKTYIHNYNSYHSSAGSGWSDDGYVYNPPKTVTVPPTTSHNGHNGRINWKDWRSRNWFCDCASNFTRRPNEQSCPICLAKKSNYILSFNSRTKNSPPAKDWSVEMDKETITLRETLKLCTNVEMYDTLMAPYLKSFVSEEKPSAISYRLKTRAHAIGRALLFHEATEIMEDDAKALEFIHFKLDDKGSLVLKDLMEYMPIIISDVSLQFRLARAIMARVTEQHVYDLCDYLDSTYSKSFAVDPEEAEEVAASITSGEKVWATLEADYVIQELLTPAGSTKESSNSNALAVVPPPSAG